MPMLFSVVLSLLILDPVVGQSPPCDNLAITDHFVSWGHKKSSGQRKIEAIIIHSSYNKLSTDSFSVHGILKEYRKINVAPHYIIDRHGNIYRLVSDNDVAYHAGRSRLPDGTVNVNAVSIGIELVNTENDSPTDEEYLSLIRLVKCLEERYHVKYLLGHSGIAPGRKTDPWNFDWKRLEPMLKRK
jgi:N-acetyl-anhydromuramyl-L-alanine amidase AmpD